MIHLASARVVDAGWRKEPAVVFEDPGAQTGVRLDAGEQVVLLLDAVAVAVAVGLSFWAVRNGLPRFRPLHAAASALGSIYLVGYVWLFWRLNVSDDGGRAAVEAVLSYSSLFRGVGLVVWVSVWWWVPYQSVRVHREVREAFDVAEPEDGR